MGSLSIAAARVPGAAGAGRPLAARHRAPVGRAGFRVGLPAVGPRLMLGGGGGRGGGGGAVRSTGGGGGGGGEGSASSLNPWAWYLGMLERSPLRTKMATGTLIASLGDLIRQSENKGVPFDVKSFVIFSLWGGAVFTPIAHFWYGLIGRVVPESLGALRFVAMMAMDQTLFPPAVTSLTFFSLTLLLGGTPDKGVDKVKRELWPTLLTNWKVWPLVQAFNFKFVPPQLQVLTVNITAVWWNYVLSKTQASS